MTDGLWRIWTDTGGTFTDCIAIDPAGAVRRAKVLSSGAIRSTISSVSPSGTIQLAGLDLGPDALEGYLIAPLARPDEAQALGRGARLTRPLDPGTPVELRTGEPAPVLAARVVTRTAPSAPLPRIEFRLATTRGTNALLERTVEPTLLVVNRGHKDLLLIGDQRRPEIFALELVRPAPWHAGVLEVGGRLDVEGSELEPIDVAQIEREARPICASGIKAVGVALIHSWANPAHEIAVGEALHRAGFEHVTLSSQIARRIKLLPRAQTSVINACLSGVISDYIGQIERALGEHDQHRIEIMSSAGGLAPSGAYLPKDSLLSGPAAGVAGAAAAGVRSGAAHVIAFDMGGTSTDVSRIDSGRFEYTFTHQVAQAQVMAPALAIESVAAGGGSICEVRAGGITVGPRSAGAEPGPACYARGGPLTITDVNLLLGRIDPSRFGIPIEIEPAQRAFDALCHDLHDPADRDGVLEGLIDIANETMADAIRAVSVRKGYDPSDYALIAFGGAGGQHACAIAQHLGMDTVIVPQDASLLSATGLGCASAERIVERQVLAPLPDSEAAIDPIFADLLDEARDRLGVDDRGSIEVRRRIVSLRFEGQEHAIDVEWSGSQAALLSAFEKQCRVIFGHMPSGRAIEFESARLIAGLARGKTERDISRAPDHTARSAGPIRLREAGAWTDAPLYERESMRPGATLRGPALVIEARSATLVPGGWSLRVDEAEALVMHSDGAAAPKSERRNAREPVEIRNELIASRLLSIGAEMGEMLRRTSISANVKERLDFSCAILDEGGQLIGSAPHIPVHLGALGLATRRLREVMELREGDVVVTNHPAFGGSHLPDITLVAPVFVEGELVAHVANRAHHAEIGGSAPGSMPPDAHSLLEEGAVIAPLRIFDRHEPRWDELRAILSSGPYPTRALADNIADLEGGVASLRRGIHAIEQLARDRGPEAVRQAMQALTDRAARVIREAICKLGAPGDTLGTADESLEDSFSQNSVIRVRAAREDESILIDFTGSSGVHEGNLNAPLAVTRSAAMYVIRLLLQGAGAGVPLNEGLLRPVRLIVPEGLLNPTFTDDPAQCPAVAAGNVETSQRVVSALVRTFGLMAAGQGTMNNTLFGNDRFGYYETVCGGSGAGPTFNGTDAIHTHMTNTAITDVEIMERRYPIRVRRFQVRPDSGGDGLQRGGHGVIRELEFLEPMRLSMITQGRTRGGIGMEGGGDGTPGRQRVIRADGLISEIQSIDGTDVKTGDVLILETPGGGAWGAPPP